jgi:aspartate aminotransferase-like enzyme/GNAT superfamily N-acetyltransferase
MPRVGRYVFKQADAGHELEAVHRLNYRTFVQEVPQHPDRGSGLLVDKFHERNVYFVALKEGRVVGMISAHGEAPFSVADRLPDPTLLERPGCRPLEVRLLAVEPEERNGFALSGLLGALYEYARKRGATDLFISAVAERVRLYQRLGFAALGPAVESGCASFVPMKTDLTRLQARQQKLIRRFKTEGGAGETLSERSSFSLLPGPVPTAPAVQAAFREATLYHRSPAFIAIFERVRRRLGELVVGRDVALWNGSGTLVNEAIAVHLSAERNAPGSGVILVNGEFGERLARQAVRCGLHARVLTWEWGRPWDLEEIAAALAEEPAGGWVWGVHLETSTGVLNDLPGLVRRAQAHGQRVCMDCISSLGSVPLDLSSVYLATGVAGKALASCAGLSMVFADAAALRPTDPERLPTTFDIAEALAARGPLHTFPSAFVLAADAALAEYASADRAHARYAHLAAVSTYVRNRLRELGLPPLAEEAFAGPGIVTFAPPGGESGEAFVERCREWGFAIGGQSGYLAARNLVQIATMGIATQEDVAPFFKRLEPWIAES